MRDTRRTGVAERTTDKIVDYHPVFTNFYPFVLSASSSYHPKCSNIFEALKAKGIDVIKLKRSIAQREAATRRST